MLLKRHSLKLAPLSWLTKGRVEYQYLLNDKWGMGLTFNRYYLSEILYEFNGWKGDIFARRYFKKAGENGAYWNFQVSAGQHFGDHLLFPGRWRFNTRKRAFVAYGLGGGIGYQFIGAKGRIIADFSATPQFYTPLPLEVLGTRPWFIDTSTWFLIGPGAVVQFRVLLGYRFS